MRRFELRGTTVTYGTCSSCQAYTGAGAGGAGPHRAPVLAPCQWWAPTAGWMGCRQWPGVMQSLRVLALAACACSKVEGEWEGEWKTPAGTWRTYTWVVHLDWTAGPVGR